MARRRRVIEMELAVRRSLEDVGRAPPENCGDASRSHSTSDSYSKAVVLWNKVRPEIQVNGSNVPSPPPPNSLPLSLRRMQNMDSSPKYSDLQSFTSTFFLDPTDPNERMRTPEKPVTLRPIFPHNFAGDYFQALFHIQAFRYSLLSFRPTPKSWGPVEEYWKGQDFSSSTSHHKNFEEQQKSSDNVMYEMQKLFAFLELSRRQYGCANLLYEAIGYKDRGTMNMEWTSVVGGHITAIFFFFYACKSCI
jgi:hypothetical protein